MLKRENVFKVCIEKELSLRDYSRTSLDSRRKLHDCALVWSDRCFHCEYSFDDLKKKIITLKESSADVFFDLQNKFVECDSRLKGTFNDGMKIIF